MEAEASKLNFYFLPLAKHLPTAAHLPGILQPAHGLKGAAFLPAGLAGAIIIFLPYIIISNQWLTKVRGFCSNLFGLSYKLFALRFTCTLGLGRRCILSRTQ
jgi:hypothetical protein